MQVAPYHRDTGRLRQEGERARAWVRKIAAQEVEGEGELSVAAVVLGPGLGIGIVSRMLGVGQV